MAFKTPEVITPTPVARANRREAHGLIELSFDITTGRYNEGYSDERIAKESGMTVDWVRKRREDEFGPLKEPAELAELREELRSLSERLAAAQRKFEVCASKNGWAA